MDTRVFELILEDTLLECPPTPPHLSHTRTRARALSLALSLSHTHSLTHSQFYSSLLWKCMLTCAVPVTVLDMLIMMKTVFNSRFR